MKAIYKVIQDTIVLDKWTDEVTIYFFGDVHRDTKNCDSERWLYFLSKAKQSMDKNTYFLGMGDYHDFASTREKKYLESEIHESTRDKFDEMAEADNRKFASECSFMRGHLLGLIEGNHSWIFANAKTSGEDLAERLESKDLGWLCHYTILFKYKNRPSTTTAVHMVLCHGKAGGKTHGITVNQVADLKQIFPVADIYCMGHDHQRVAQPCSVLVPVCGQGTFQIKQKRQFLCRSGSFLKGYQDGSSSYEIFKLYKPNDLGALKMKISFHADHNRTITDIRAEI